MKKIIIFLLVLIILCIAVVLLHTKNKNNENNILSDYKEEFSDIAKEYYIVKNDTSNQKLDICCICDWDTVNPDKILKLSEMIYKDIVVTERQYKTVNISFLSDEESNEECFSVEGSVSKIDITLKTEKISVDQIAYYYNMLNSLYLGLVDWKQSDIYKAEDLEHFKNINNLYYENEAISDSEVENIKKSFPNIEIIQTKSD